MSRVGYFVNCILTTALLVVGTYARGQTINATTNTGWTNWTTSSGVMLDTFGDQQTGQGSDDFVGAIVGSNTYATLMSQAGKASYDSANDYLFLRARMDSYSADDAWGNGGNWGTGMDINGDGKLDLIMMFSEGSGKAAKRTHTIQFGTPGTGANNSPSTTSWTFPTQTAISLTVNQGYDLQNASAIDGYSVNATADAWLTFGLSFAQLQTAIRSYAVGTTAGQFSNYTVDYSSRIAFVAFTSTQNNALNQDLAGTSGNTSAVTTWATLGAITPPMGPGGYIPEPATYAQLGAMLMIGGIALYRRRRGQTAGPSEAGRGKTEIER